MTEQKASLTTQDVSRQLNSRSNPLSEAGYLNKQASSDQVLYKRDQTYSSHMNKRKKPTNVKPQSSSYDANFTVLDSRTVDLSSHTDQKQKTLIKTVDRKLPQSNKDSKSLTLASQARLDRRKILGDLVAQKMTSLET